MPRPGRPRHTLTPAQDMERLAHVRKVRNAANKRYRKAHRAACLRREAKARKRRRAKRTEEQRLKENTTARTNYAANGQEREAARGIAKRHSYAFLHHTNAPLTVIRAERMDQPPLLYIDAAGRLFREDFRSAQQLIRDFVGAQHAAPHTPSPNRNKGHRP